MSHPPAGQRRKPRLNVVEHLRNRVLVAHQPALADILAPDLELRLHKQHRLRSIGSKQQRWFGGDPQ